MISFETQRNHLLLKKIIKTTERHAAQAPALRERHHQLFNFQ